IEYDTDGMDCAAADITDHGTCDRRGAQERIIHRIEFIKGNPAEIEYFRTIMRQFAIHDLGDEIESDTMKTILADIPEHPGHAGHTDVQTCLLANLAHGGIHQPFSLLNTSAGQTPLPAAELLPLLHKKN